MTTIKDIAELAGVSPATVSRILNTDQGLKVSPKTRQRVLAVAANLNYQKLPKKGTETLGTIAITSWHKREYSLSSLYFQAILWGVETTLKTAGYKIVRTFINEERSRIEAADGIIALGQLDKQSLHNLQVLNKPLVVLNQNTLQYGISCISPDYVHPVKELIQQLSAAGHERIGMIEGESTTYPTPDPRALAFREALRLQGRLDEGIIFKGNFSIEAGYVAMKQAIDSLGENLPHVFFACSDTLAFGALRALSEAAIPVPERVGLIGFGNNEMGAFTTPSLSTVDVSPHQIGAIGALTLLNSLTGLQTEPVHTTTQGKLIFRESLPQPASPQQNL